MPDHVGRLFGRLAMRLFPLSPRRLWLMALLPFSAFAQHQEADLTVRGRVERIQLCRLDADMARMDLDLHLIIKNTGHERIILPRAAPEVYYWKTAPDMETLASSKYGHINLTIIDLPGLDLPTVPRKDYRILKPGKSMEYSSQLTVPERHLGLGRYLLQVIVANWYGSVEKRGELARNWRRYGKFWEEPFETEPIEFTVPEGFRLTECE